MLYWLNLDKAIAYTRVSQERDNGNNVMSLYGPSERPVRAVQGTAPAGIAYTRVSQERDNGNNVMSLYGPSERPVRAVQGTAPAVPFFASGSNSKGEVAPPSPIQGSLARFQYIMEPMKKKDRLPSFCVLSEGLKHPQGVLFFLLAISLIGFIFIELMVLRMIRSGDLDKEKAWFAYFMGACTIVEALFVNIVVLS
ncbi:hypothetical protein BSL78_20283 [Apostichopus japonicus]|uniref:Uncharacterized protein n=1 Tax=Stichopus japonicus TaxID=307972 RepID=A0A2G8K4C4_STIJA|nr:hypothetical protein BSL78_20283 [Apostichopus japonicus]